MVWICFIGEMGYRRGYFGVWFGGGVVRIGDS